MKNPPETLPPLIPESTPKVKEKKDLKEIIITVDKYTWESLLIRLKQILKTCYLLSEDIPMSKKLKKSNPLKSILANENENFQTILSSMFRIVTQNSNF